eukprot:2976364-Amphidinium_carterae.1
MHLQWTIGQYCRRASRRRRSKKQLPCAKMPLTLVLLQLTGGWRLQRCHAGAADDIQLEDAIYVQRWDPSLLVKGQRALCLTTKSCQVLLQNRMGRILHERVDSCHIFVPWMGAGPPNKGER